MNIFLDHCKLKEQYLYIQSISEDWATLKFVNNLGMVNFGGVYKLVMKSIVDSSYYSYSNCYYKLWQDNIISIGSLRTGTAH